MSPSGSPTARPCASNDTIGYFCNASITGVDAFPIAFPSLSSETPQPSITTQHTLMSDEAQSQLLQSIHAILGSDPLLQVNRLMKFESKFGGIPSVSRVELTSAYKQLSKRSETLEQLLVSLHPRLDPQTLKNTVALQEFLLNVAQEQSVGVDSHKKSLLKEKQTLSQKVRDLEQIQALESAARADMYHALQSELDQKQEV